MKVELIGFRSVMVLHLVIQLEAGNVFEQDLAISRPKTDRSTFCLTGQKDFVYGLCLKNGYQDKEPPNRTTNEIYFSLKRIQFLEIREKEKYIDMSIEIIDTWEDHRISFRNQYTRNIGPPDITINWYDKAVENQNIWYPDGMRMKTVSQEVLTHSPFSHLRFRNSDTKPITMFVSRVREIRTSFYCEFHSSKFPLDFTNCTFRLSNEDARGLQLHFDSVMKHNGTETFEKDGFNISKTYEKGFNLEDSYYIGFNLGMKRVLSPFLF